MSVVEVTTKTNPTSVMEVTIKMDQMGETVAVELTVAVERIVPLRWSKLTVAGELTVAAELDGSKDETAAVELIVAVTLRVGTERAEEWH